MYYSYVLLLVERQKKWCNWDSFLTVSEHVSELFSLKYDQMYYAAPMNNPKPGKKRRLYLAVAENLASDRHVVKTSYPHKAPYFKKAKKLFRLLF